MEVFEWLFKGAMNRGVNWVALEMNYSLGNLILIMLSIYLGLQIFFMRHLGYLRT